MSLESIQNYCFQENFAGNTHIKCVPIEWVLNYPEFSKDGHNFSESIDLIPTKDWLLFPCVPETLDFRDRERPTTHGVVDTPTISGFLPGDTPMISSVLNSAKANQWVVILYYTTGEAKVIGSPDYPARFSSSLNNRGNLNSGKGFDIEFFSEGDFKSFFLELPPTPPVSSCLPAIIYNAIVSPTYTASVASGSALYLPKEDVNINGSLLVTKNSVEDIDIAVIDSNNDPVIVDLTGGNIKIPLLPSGTCPPGTVNIVDSNLDPIGSQDVASGGTETFVVSALPCGAPTPSGIAYQEPNISSVSSVSYADYDAAWRSQNNAYINVQPDNPEYYQTLDINSSDPYNTLLHNNIFGNKHRFTNGLGDNTPYYFSQPFFDHLTGRVYVGVASGNYRPWASFMAYLHDAFSSTEYYAPSIDEFNSLKNTRQSGYNINGNALPINSNYLQWTCNIDESNTLNAIRLTSDGHPISSLSKSTSTRGYIGVFLMHPISNP